jgi:hypothetical protein
LKVNKVWERAGTRHIRFHVRNEAESRHMTEEPGDCYSAEPGAIICFSPALSNAPRRGMDYVGLEKRFRLSRLSRTE